MISKLMHELFGYKTAVDLLKKKLTTVDNSTQLLINNAKLIKFTFEPKVPKIEYQIVETLLNMGDQIHAHAITINPTHIQFIAKDREFSHKSIFKNIPHVNAETSKSHKIISLTTTKTFIINERKYAGLYLLQEDGNFAFTRRRDVVYDELYKLGFLSFAGNVYQAVCPSSVAATDFKNLRFILETAMTLEKNGHFRTALKTQLNHFIKTYRWPGYSSIKTLVRAL